MNYMKLMEGIRERRQQVREAVEVPAGYLVVESGTSRANDLCWDDCQKTWRVLAATEAGQQYWRFWLLARRNKS